MKYICISGGWRKINPEIERQIRSNVKKIMQSGNGIISGGALNVDYVTLDEALKNNLKAERIKIFIPTTLEQYIKHYRKHAKLGTITIEQAEDLIRQLSYLKKINPKALIECPDENFTEETKKDMYYERNSREIQAADELMAFHIKIKESEGAGTLDTIKKAKTKGIPVKIFSFDFTKK
ncbi:hypothetical protein FJ208_00260 [Candidatus Gribaldobacteria bacterium]|nr:hypothetical protein [Candidatus Gribaldobacteria bacterium]